MVYSETTSKSMSQASHPAIQLSQAEAERLTSLQKRLQAHEDRAPGGPILGVFRATAN